MVDLGKLKGEQETLFMLVRQIPEAVRAPFQPLKVQAWTHSRLRNEVGYKSEYSLEQGVTEYYAWIRRING